MSVSDEDKAAAASIKAKANEAFKCRPARGSNSLECWKLTRLVFGRVVAKQFMDAAKIYGEALQKNPTDPTIWLNRAFTRMNLVSGLFSSSAARPIERVV
jgi:hypothetical protein